MAKEPELTFELFRSFVYTGNASPYRRLQLVTAELLSAGLWKGGMGRHGVGLSLHFHIRNKYGSDPASSIILN